jgi:hypothetical protein
MVKPPPCRIPSVGDDLQALDDEKQLCKKGTPLQEIRSMTNMDLDKKEDSPNGVSPEKVNLERTSGNESIEEDAMESKHVIPNIRSDDVGREIEVTSDHEVKEVVLFDIVDSSVQTKDNVAKEKSVAPSEKRKPEGMSLSPYVYTVQWWIISCITFLHVYLEPCFFSSLYVSFFGDIFFCISRFTLSVISSEKFIVLLHDHCH